MKALIYKSTSSFENRKPELRILLKYNELEKGFPGSPTMSTEAMKTVIEGGGKLNP